MVISSALFNRAFASSDFPCTFTSVTYPSSVSGFSSISSKILSAPASAIAIRLICCAIWDTGIQNVFERFKNATIIPTVTFPTPFTAINPPIKAINTYCRFPSCIMVGIRIFPYLFASVESSHSILFFVSNPCFASSS